MDKAVEERLGTEGELLQEAAQIIKTIRGPSMKAVAMYQLGGGDGLVFLDSERYMRYDQQEMLGSGRKQNQ